MVFSFFSPGVSVALDSGCQDFDFKEWRPRSCFKLWLFEAVKWLIIPVKGFYSG